MKKIQKMARIALVDRGEQKAAAAGYVGFLLSFWPCRVGRRYVVDRRQIGLVRPRYLDIRKIPGLVRRRLADLAFLGTRNRDDVFFLNKLTQLGQLARRGLDQVLTLGLDGACFFVALVEGRSRRICLAFSFKGSEIAVEIGAGDLFELDKV